MATTLFQIAPVALGAAFLRSALGFGRNRTLAVRSRLHHANILRKEYGNGHSGFQRPAHACAGKE